MATPDQTDEKGMTGASGQRWEPADEGIILEAPNQPPPGSDKPPERDTDNADPMPIRPSVKPEPGKESGAGDPSR